MHQRDVWIQFIYLGLKFCFWFSLFCHYFWFSDFFFILLILPFFWFLIHIHVFGSSEQILTTFRKPLSLSLRDIHFLGGFFVSFINFVALQAQNLSEEILWNFIFSSSSYKLVRIKFWYISLNYSRYCYTFFHIFWVAWAQFLLYGSNNNNNKFWCTRYFL